MEIKNYSKYRCEIINFKKLSNKIFIGENLYDKLINFHKFQNNYGTIEISSNSYSSAIEVNISINHPKTHEDLFSKFYLPFIILKNLLLESGCKNISENIYQVESIDKFINIMNNELLNIPKSLLEIE